jgi:iron complex transport system substrate-binding protein
MSRAVITASEAKAAALADLDIRSGPTPGENQATGTGTDNILVVEGGGPPAELSGGHSRLGELIAHAVHAGVVEAVRRQNGLTAGRSIFQRLRERRIDLTELVGAIRGSRPWSTSFSSRPTVVSSPPPWP